MYRCINKAGSLMDTGPEKFLLYFIKNGGRRVFGGTVWLDNIKGPARGTIKRLTRWHPAS